jgi:hypothetical protein
MSNALDSVSMASTKLHRGGLNGVRALDEWANEGGDTGTSSAGGAVTLAEAEGAWMDEAEEEDAAAAAGDAEGVEAAGPSGDEAAD